MSKPAYDVSLNDLIDAVKSNSSNIVQNLLDNGGDHLLNELDATKNTAIFYAVDFPEMLSFLLERGADVNGPQNSILCPAVRSYHKSYIRNQQTTLNSNSNCPPKFENDETSLGILLNQNDVNLEMSCNAENGFTALFDAIELQNLEAVRLLLNKSANAK